MKNNNIHKNNLPARFLLALLLLCTGFVQTTLAQSDAKFNVDSAWAKLPGDGKWDGSTSWITADGQGNIVVLVRVAPYFRMLNRDGTFVRAWGEDGMFATAHSLTIDAQGFYWVTDSQDHIVRKLSPEGEVLMTLGQKGVTGGNDSPDAFNQPNHVAIAPNGDIYVSDGYTNARIAQFSPDGRYVRSITGSGEGTEPGQLKLPHGVALDSTGRILVNDSDNARVSVFNPDGSYVETWPYPSRGGVVVAADDTVYISDVNAGIVNIVDRNGKLLDSVSSARAHGLGVDTNGDIYTSGASALTVTKITRK